MYPLVKIKQNIAKLINQALGKKLVKATDLIFPPKPEFGDLSLPCFELAKKYKKTAVEMAELLVRKTKLDQWIVATKAIGPYLNFTFNKTKLAQEVINNQINKLGVNYGLNQIGAGQRVMIEYSNANTHKAYHVGHLRNLCFGDAVAKILQINGYQVIPVSYINDFGIHAAKTIWAYQTFFSKEKLPADKGYFLGQVYSRAVSELEKDEAASREILAIMKKIESQGGKEFKLWQKTREWSINGFSKIYHQLGIEFEHIFYESDYLNKGLDLIAKLYKKLFLTKSQGIIIANLEKYNLGVLPFLRSDSTALYPVADLPLAIEKFKKYKIDKSIYVVDVRQSLYFKQLFKILELLGYKKPMAHLSYEFVKLPSGLISSRAGQVITYQDLRAEFFKKALSETRQRHRNWSGEKIKSVATKLTNGAIKFEMVKVGADKIITFDINQALRFDGFTAAYLQYTCARINSIIRKSKLKKSQFNNFRADNLTEDKENNLILKLAKYPEVVAVAAKNYQPAEIAQFLFNLAQSFNDYYHSLPVLKAKKETKLARLALISAVSQVIANGLTLFGIEVMEKM